METMRENLREYLLKTSGALSAVPSDVRADGSLSGLDYFDPSRGSSWTPARHLSVMRRLCLNFPDVAAKMLAYWVKTDSPNSNWWWPEIGIPKALCETMLMLGMRTERDSAAWKLLARSKMGMTGQNKVWLAEIHLMKGLLLGDAGMVDEGLGEILSEVEIRTAEGLQPDWSFQQHGPQLQFGNYGLSWFENMVKWMLVCAGTPAAFPPEKVRLLEGYYIHGLRWTLTDCIMDINASARQFGFFLPQPQPHEMQKYASVRALARRLRDAGYLQGIDDDPRGTTCYPRSGYIIRRARNFFFSVRMSAKWLRSAETCNSENMQGLYTGDGGMFMYRYDRWNPDELALRDWRRIPGTTELLNAASLVPNMVNNTDGDCRCWSQGDYGAAMMLLKNDKIAARKAYFILGDCLVFMGAGITSNVSGEVDTTVMQRLKTGDVVMNGAALADGEHRIVGPAEFTFDGMRYVFPEDGDYRIQIERRQGDWNKIHLECPCSIPAEGTMVTVWCNHGEKPCNAGYAYMILPENAETPSVEYLRGENIIGVRTGGCTLAACFQPGRLGDIASQEFGLYTKVNAQ